MIISLLFQTTYRGVKNPEAVERKRKKQEEMEKQAMTTSVSGGGGLKVSYALTLKLCDFQNSRSVINVILEGVYKFPVILNHLSNISLIKADNLSPSKR